MIQAMDAGRKIIMRENRLFLFHEGEKRGFEARAQSFGPDGLFCTSAEVFEPLEKLECEVRIPGRTMAVVRFLVEVQRVIADRRIEGFGLDCKLLDCEIHRSAA